MAERIKIGDTVTLSYRGISKGLFRDKILGGIEITGRVEKILSGGSILVVFVHETNSTNKWHSTFWRKYA